MNGNNNFRHDKTFKNPWLICRIKEPFRGKNEAAVDPMSVVEGTTERVTEEQVGPAGAIMHQILRVDYMGAAEFEWGSIPYTLTRMAAEREEYGVWQFTLLREDMPPEDWCERRVKKGDAQVLTGPVTLFTLSRRGHASDMEVAIRRMISGEQYLKERTMMVDCLKYDQSYNEIVAWLDINNGAFWSANERLVRAMAKLVCQI